MTAEPRRFGYASMGTQWTMTLWDTMSDAAFMDLEKTVTEMSHEFDRMYSRFNKQSLIWSLTEKRGVAEVPKDLVSMLRLYETLHDLSGGKCNPLVGFALSDMGYDDRYSLTPKEHIRSVPDFHAAITIVDDDHIELRESVLIDLGALGKGYFVDKIAALFDRKGLQRFLVDGSGDIVYRGNGEPIRVGLEHPGDTTKAIGIVEMRDGAMCSSAGNRRRWNKYHHTIDPQTLESPDEIIATWVMSTHAAVADGLATCLFMVEPEGLAAIGPFEYCLLNKEYKVKRSEGFTAELL